jgi:hypothetical protein
MARKQYPFFAAALDLPIGIGNVYYVIPSTKAYLASFLQDYQTTYSDSSVAVYTDTGSGDGIAAAITACKGGRNDYIIVGTGNYNLTAALTLAGKSSVHLIGLNGGGYDIGTMGAAALTQTGSFENVIMSPYSELTGFQIINKAAYSAVTIADGIWRANIHNNYFHMTQGSACSIIKASGSGMSYGTIAKNRFQTWVGGTITYAIEINGASSIIIDKNIINNWSGTMSTAIYCNQCAQGVVMDNIISDCSGAGTITVGIDLGNGNTAIGNRCALPTGSAFSAGTANRTFVDNRDAQAGGQTVVET